MTQQESQTERTVVSMPPIEISRRDFVWTIALAAPFLFIHLTTPAGLPWWLMALATGLPGMVGLLLGLKAFREVKPDAAELALALSDHGLELKKGLGRIKRLEFEQISRVVASSAIDGAGESTMALLLYSPGCRTAVEGDLLYGSSLLERLSQLPGFDREAYAHSWADDDSFRHSLWPKRTVLFRKGDTGSDAPPTSEAT